MAGTSVDLLFFPIDTIKTRLQSAQGFSQAGGFRGVYKGIGSVVVGSAPGGESSLSLLSNTIFNIHSQAAVFFSTYEAMKKSLPLPSHLAPVNHMLSASVAEVVRLSALILLLPGYSPVWP
jgi:solute carrier family 25 S-adenosylmethionine transporter 26